MLINLLLTAVILGSCQDDFCEMSNSFFSSNCYSEDVCTVNFNDLVSFSWDKLYFFESWTYPDEMTSVMKIKHSLDIVPEGKTYVVFVKSGEVVKYYSSDCYLTFLGKSRDDKTGVVTIDSKHAEFNVETKIFGGVPSYYLKLVN